MPVKHFAAIDMGTNSFHLIIVELAEDGSFKIVDRQREVIRLGSRQGNNLNIITEDEMRLAIALLKSFKKLADLYNAGLFAVATSAVREAENKDEFISRVLQETGINIEVLQGSKEAELIYKGAEKALSLENKNSLCIDIGGGSSEIIYSESGKIIFAESIKIGAVRLSRKFFPDYIFNKDRVKQCEEYAESEIVKNKNLDFNIKFQLAAGTSGTIQSIARTINLIKHRTSSLASENLTFNREDLETFYNLIMSKTTVEERLTIVGIEEKRADILPAGLIVLRKLFDLFNINEMKISDYALREGIILQEINS
jgi:exopolyphosphatase / guanosine-5'-triphosphate,3'-diphosphate pyrophosphatase